MIGTGLSATPIASGSDPPIACPIRAGPYARRGVSRAQITKAFSAMTTIAQTG
jgi:hypothetical protein